MEAFNNSDEIYFATFRRLWDFFFVIFKCVQINWMFLINTIVLEDVNLMLHLILNWWTGCRPFTDELHLNEKEGMD